MSVSYTEKSFWKKVKKVVELAGKEIIEKVLLLYYATKNPKMPSHVKAMVFGTLAYFILPIDAIPDYLIPIGYTDDLALIIATLEQISQYIDDEVIQKAEKKLKDLFD